MDTSAQALIDTEEQASTGMRAPMSVLVLNISRSTPDGILNTEVRANRDVTRHCSRYKLRAIVEYTHKKGGHFVTHVRHLCAGSPDRWHTCDDETVTQCGTDPPVTATRWCTMLWYEQLPMRLYTPYEQSRRKVDELRPCTLLATQKQPSPCGQGGRAAWVAAVAGMTFGEALQHPGSTLADLRRDIQSGYLSVIEPPIAPDQRSALARTAPAALPSPTVQLSAITLPHTVAVAPVNALTRLSRHGVLAASTSALEPSAPT